MIEDLSRRSLPALPYPMYTLAMQGCVVTSTGFEKEAKTAIQTKVQMMGGVYANAFTDQVTHLVARVVRSTKYDVALNKETPIMTDEWVEKVGVLSNLSQDHDLESLLIF